MAPGRPPGRRQDARFDDIDEARFTRGWSETTLAESARRYLAGLKGTLTESEIRKYQKGRSDPPASVLAALGAALGLPFVRVPSDPEAIESAARTLRKARKRKR